MIRVENLGKKYMIGHQAEGRSNYVALRDVLTDGARSLVKRFTVDKNRSPAWGLFQSRQRSPYALRHHFPGG